jgi:hypothetical protein
MCIIFQALSESGAVQPSLGWQRHVGMYAGARLRCGKSEYFSKQKINRLFIYEAEKRLFARSYSEHVMLYTVFTYLFMKIIH